MRNSRNNLNQVRRNQFLEGLVNQPMKFETDTMGNRKLVQNIFKSDAAYRTVVFL